MAASTVLPAFVSRPGPSPTIGRDAAPKSIEFVGIDPIQFRASNDDAANAFDEALVFSYDHRDDMGYPWLDWPRGVLRLAVVNDRGRSAATTVMFERFPGLRVEIAETSRSIADLDRIADEITRWLDAGVPEADLIWMTEPDQLNNRVVVTMSKKSDAMAGLLESTYGADSVAIRIRPGGPATLANRDSDSPLYWGGAFISSSTGKNCTTGFAWSVGGQSAMLTAAHCISTGGRVSYPAHANVGGTTANVEENWSDANGTQFYAGQNVFRGDIALVRYDSAGSEGKIYSGAPHTGISSGVAGMLAHWAQFGDAVCDNGVVTGEWCGMVIQSGVDKWYLVNGINVWARHVYVAEAVGPTCPTHGDSGSPVYHKRSDGRVDAVGILSGSLPVGVACDIYFTDTHDANAGLLGILKTSP